MIILQALYFMLPAYFANMAAVFATKIFGSKFAWPLDFNLQFRGKPLLGQNKTWRGLVAGVAVGILIIFVQKYLYGLNFFEDLSFFNYTAINAWLYGFLFGFGVILGDAVKSFFKRRINLKPGDKWFPWDQLDFLGALVLIHFVFIPSWPATLLIIIISPILPLITNWLGFKLKIKKVSW